MTARILSTLLFICITCLTVSCQAPGENQGSDCFNLQPDGSTMCGTIEVPVNYSDPEGATTPFAYVILESTEGKPANPPLVFLQGGPGGSAIALYEFWQSNPLRTDRDIILIDQRGTGFSRPYCEWVGAKFYEILAADHNIMEEEKSILREMVSCSEEMQSKGADKAMYSTMNSVRDLESLRKHLGYERWNLYGASYGSKLALTYMREFPESVNAALLQGIFPPEVNMYEYPVTNFSHSLNKLIEACESDPLCYSRYPGFRTDYFKLLSSMRESPVKLQDNFILNAQDFIIITHLLLYQRATAGRIPAMVEELKSADSPSLQYELSILRSVLSSMNAPVYWSIMAFEELPFMDPEDFSNDLERNEALKPGHAMFSTDPAVLKEWHLFRADDLENEPIYSDIPVLVLNGEFDPITPTSNAAGMMATLPNAQLFELKGEGHSVFGWCFFQMTREFLNEPGKKIQNDCTAKTPEYSWN